jgi:hypothetical protein
MRMRTAECAEGNFITRFVYFYLALSYVSTVRMKEVCIASIFSTPVSDIL